MSYQEKQNIVNIFSGLLATVIALALGMPVYGIFIGFVAAGLLAGIIENSSQIYYYIKGV